MVEKPEPKAKSKSRKPVKTPCEHALKSVPDQRNVVTISLYPSGLKNNGNTCYLNSLLQSLLAVPAFWEPSARRLHPELPPLVRNFLETLVSMKRANNRKKVSKETSDKEIDTKPLLRELQRVKAAAGDPSFRWRRQNDAAEVLSTFIDELRKAFGGWTVISTNPREHSCCEGCKQSSVADYEHPYLILEPKERLHESLEEFMDKKSECRRCTKCKSTQVISQRLLLHSAPKVLMIQLNRILADGSGRKNETVVDVSSQSLDLPTKRQGRLVVSQYTLKAVICHHGDISNTGHYVTYAKQRNEWYRFSDLYVRLLTSDLIKDSMITKHAYMYVFERLE